MEQYESIMPYTDLRDAIIAGLEAMLADQTRAIEITQICATNKHTKQNKTKTKKTPTNSILNLSST